MKLTNKHNLPKSMVNIIRRKMDRERKFDYTATGLIRPPQMLQLELRHDAEITVDVADFIWAVLGEGVHYILQGGAPEGALAEERLSIVVDGKTIGGKPDLFHNEIVEDWKITSVWAFLLGDKPEWEAQPNIYALLFREYGFSVKGIKIHAILRDWEKSKALYGSNYPDINYFCKNIPLWDNETAWKYLLDRLAVHEGAAAERDELLPECSMAEKWERPTKWAVMRKGRKSAISVLPTEEEANKYMEDNPNKKAQYVEKRPGVRNRCKSLPNGKRYCVVAPFCHQKKREDKAND